MNERQYLCKTKIGAKAGLFLGGGFFSLCMFVLMFCLMILSPPAKQSALTTNVPTIFGIFAFIMISYGVSLLRSTVRVGTDDDGVTIEGLVSRKRIYWYQIARLQREQQSQLWSNVKLDALILFDEKGKKLGSINSMIENFEQLSAEVEARSSAVRGAATFDRVGEAERKLSKTKRQAWGVLAGGLLFSALSITIIVWGLNDFVHERKFSTEGVEAEAAIEKHYIHNVTPRMEYSFTDAAGKRFKRNVMMEKPAWKQLEGSKSVSIRYLPSDPEWSHLRSGEISDANPVEMMIIGGVGLFIGGFIAVGGVMGRRGYDMEFVDGKIKLTRPGEVLPTVAPTPTPASPPPPPLTATQTTPVAGVPRGILALAMLNVIFGAFGILLNAFRVIANILFASKPFQAGDIVLEAENTLAPILVSGADLIFCALMALSAAGLYWLKPWGRKLAMISAGGQLLISLISLAFSVLMLSRGVEGGTPEQNTAYAVGIGASIFMIFLGMVYPAVVIGVLVRRSAGEMFRAQ